MSTLELSSPVFSILSGLIEEKVGLHYELFDKDLLREKASSRAMDAGFDSLLDYYYFLKYDANSTQELNELVDTLVVNETYFFREWPAIKVVTESFIKPWISEGKKPRIWSAACASGEEPLSLAMLLQSQGLLKNVEIVASDISSRVLDKARSGKFGKRSVRTFKDENLARKFLKEEPYGYSVSNELTSAICWRKQNLLDPDQIGQNGLFDVILCRNVLIYFSDATVASVLYSLSKVLAPGGILVVGVSESLLRFGNVFIGEEVGGSFVYRTRANS